jgi:PAS domain S-box-containing protein
MKDKIGSWATKLLATRSSDPEQARRGRVLGILLLGMLTATLLMTSLQLAGILPSDLTPAAGDELILDATACLGLVILLQLNRMGYVRLVSYAFLFGISAGVSFIELWQLGRVDLLYVIPTVAASFLVHPSASFAFAALSSLGHTLAYLNAPARTSYNYLTVIGLFMMALTAWLVATSLDAALREIRRRAEELDRRVLSRTRDLTEALRHTQSEANKTQAILESISDGVIVFDQSARAIVANPAACAILGRREADVLAKKVRRIMGDSVSQEDQAVICSLIEGKQPSGASLKAAWNRKTLAISIAPIRLPSPQQEGTLVVFRDITKEAEVDQMKSEFVSIVSHELRTPMTAIKGYVDLLMLGSAGAVTEIQRNFLSIIKTNADRLSEMVDELLDLSRIEAGKAQLNFEAVSMRRVILEVVALLQKGFEDRGIHLRLDLPNPMPDVLADPGRLNQIITNLLSNALKYTQEGSVHVTARVVGDYMQVDVADTGAGMTEADMTKLFTRFFRASTTRDRKTPGTGLGLAITRSLVEMQGGRIWATSTVDRGSTFSFTIPILPEPLIYIAAEERTLDESTPRSAPAKIMIVDNELHIAQLFRYQLETDGYTVVITTKGAEALALAQRERPTLILLDVALPDMDGYQLLRQFKQSQELKHIPVIITSTAIEEEKGFALGAADYLAKPMDNRYLLTSVRRVLAQIERETPWSVLVVDDEPDVRHWLSLALSNQGFRVSEARDGKEGLTSIAAQSPDLILLDLEMPAMDGWAVISALKSSPLTAQIPVIVLTGSPIESVHDKMRAMDMGVQQFLAKPVSIETLVREIRRRLA